MINQALMAMKQRSLLQIQQALHGVIAIVVPM
jgi:hypothetical protein